MNPIKPKYSDTSNVQWSISKRSKEIISQYSKYTKYEESELIDILICDILEDDAFVTWMKSRRYTTKVNKLIFGDNTVEDDTNEDDEKIGNL